MYIDFLPLDISKNPKEIIIDKVNAVNGLQLDFDDFVFEDPEAYAGSQYPKANTKVKIVPKTTSQFYNSFTIYYTRMSLDTILDNDRVSIARGTGTDLSDLMPAINQAYNINMTGEDYFDTTLPLVNTLDPLAEVPVMVVAKPTSFLFIGNFKLMLNRVATNPVPQNLESADVFIVLDQPYEPVHKSTMVCHMTTGEVVDNFKFLRNCNTVSLVEITKIKYIKNFGILVYGTFKFNIAIQGVDQDIDTNCILISFAGGVIGNMNDLFGASTIDVLDFVKSNSNEALYVLDQTDSLGTEPSKFYRFNAQGTLDVGFSLIGVNEPVLHARIDSQNRIYAVTEKTVLVDTDNNPATPDVPVRQQWIQRFFDDGTRDSSFNKVVLTTTDNQDSWSVGYIDPIEGDINTTDTGIYVGMVFKDQLHSLGPMLLVNDVPLVDGSVTTDYGILPIIKINNIGIQDTNFVSRQVSYKPEAVYEFDSTQVPKVGDDYISSSGNNVVMLSYRENPITGVLHKLPMLYDKTGVLKRIGGDAYFDSYVWSKATSIDTLYRGSVVVSGMCRLPDGQGGYLPQEHMVAAYDAKTQVEGIIFKPSTGLLGKPTIKTILVYNAG